MNFLDPYDVAGGTSTPPQAGQSLNEEVSQVIGQLGRFWGWAGKQSQTALEVARKDLSGVVSQAQKELTKLTSTGESQVATSTPSGSQSEEPRTSSETLKPEATSSPENEAAPTSNTSIQNMFSRLQSSLPPNVVSTVQANLPESLKHFPENTDFSQLRTTLTTEFQRLQGVTRTQAEEYVHKSEVLLREAGEVLRDAVKVLPPDEAGTGDSGLIWDGSDMWMLPSDTGDLPANDKGKGKANLQNAVTTRAEALLKRLRSDPEILKHDPEADGGIKEIYMHWLVSDVDSQEGGIESVHWTAIIDQTLGSEDGQTLQTTLNSLVPSELSKDVFWKRYFFRVHQIQTEEEKRKALLQGTMENEDDFSWEDDDVDDGSASNVTKKAESPEAHPSESSGPEKSSAPSSQINTPANTSPRESSEDSYDVVSGNVSASGEAQQEEKKDTESDGDSDWE
ncbi:hypothetical protein BDP27DRAFT_1336626 [Rhodocollybia butyracea]|uniref:BSD domain-containing protein n=1 Tax=Rhodocollybia butyracea TaxID=206335 RepID=A0A9P5U0C2_9AGAR|nr:hypothetical protein BDP27DRAFT_1336626 [Rhodocollybia butyracea]